MKRMTPQEFATNMAAGHEAFKLYINSTLCKIISKLTDGRYTPEQVEKDLEPLLADNKTSPRDAINAVLVKYGLDEYKIRETPKIQ